jgi:hypothetical protein
MFGAESGVAGARATLPSLSLGMILRRVRDMVLVWLLFGGICGACSDLARSGSWVGIVSGVLAGMIVMPFLGVFLGLAGARVRPTLIGGGLGGLLGALLATVVGSPSPTMVASFGLILGGLTGGTIGAMLWWMNFVARALGFSFRGR